MHWLKVVALLVITLAVMRTCSWVLGWVLLRFAAAGVRFAAVVSNAVACAAFVLLLYFSLLPGEAMDFAAVAFGVAVFGVYTAWDLFRNPWKRKA